MVRERAQQLPQRGAARIGVAERSAEERREAEAEHRAEIALRGRPQHAFVEALRRGIHEERGETLRGLRAREGRSRRDLEQLVDTRVGRALLSRVPVEALAAALSQEPRTAQDRDRA